MAADPDLDVPAEEPREPPQPEVPPQPEPDPAEEEKRRREAEFALLNKEIDRVERKCRDYEATAMWSCTRKRGWSATKTTRRRSRTW